ncbi:hypothetical protein [Luteolibacter soli]|uniref:DUF4034 domain-containing protein n=1 Tax=Luteolibacter soli TaxID=3135280 RepID=A0ABU9AVK4_9BACT
MRRNKLIILVATHLAMVAIALLLARPGQGNESSNQDGNTASNSTGTTASNSDKGTSRQASRFKPSTSWKGGEFARAWKALPTAKLTTGERIQTQRELLKQWAEVDLAAAIDAALAEAWDSDNGNYYDPTGPLLQSLAEALAKDPAYSWDMLHGRQFDLGTGMLRFVWIRAVGQKDPIFLASKMGELSWRDREKAINACRMNLQAGSETATKLFETLSRLPEDVVSAEDLLTFSDGVTSPLSPEEFQQTILSLAGQNDRMAKLRAIQWGQMLSSKDPSEINAQLSAIPQALRWEVEWAAFTTPDVTGAGKNTNTLALAGLLVQDGAWDKLESRTTVSQLQSLASNGAAKEVADFATTLPVRKETTELFHRSVDHYLRENMDTARDWMAGLPAGEWRDRAYAEYSQQALNAHNNPEASRWALDQIGNPTFKGEAESWRSQWEKRTGWKQQ